MMEVGIILLIAVLIVPFVLRTLDIKIGWDKELPSSIFWMIKIVLLVGFFLLYLWIIRKLEDSALVMIIPVSVVFAGIAFATLFASPPKINR